MLGVTHMAGGLASGAAVGLIFGHPFIGMGVGAIGSLFPDIDEPGSLIGQKLPIIAWPIKLIFGHRTVTHTIEFSIGMALLIGFAVYCFNPAFALLAALTFLAGELSHILILDSLTKGGTHPVLLIHSLHLHGPFRTGNFLTETPIALLLLFLALKISGMY